MNNNFKQRPSNCRPRMKLEGIFPETASDSEPLLCLLCMFVAVMTLIGLGLVNNPTTKKERIINKAGSFVYEQQGTFPFAPISLKM